MYKTMSNEDFIRALSALFRIKIQWGKLDRKVSQAKSKNEKLEKKFAKQREKHPVCAIGQIRELLVTSGL